MSKINKWKNKISLSFGIKNFENFETLKNNFVSQNVDLVCSRPRKQLLFHFLVFTHLLNIPKHLIRAAPKKVFLHLQSVTKLVRLAPPAPFFNVVCKFTWSFMANTAWHSLFKLDTTFNQGWGEVVVTFE